MPRGDSLSTKIQLLCVWAGPLGAVLFLVFFWPVAGFVPPPSPHWSAQHVASFFAANRTSIRVGLLGSMISVTLFFPFFSVISIQIARIEGRRPILAVIQFAGALLLMVFFFLCLMLWIVATFRPDVAPSTVRVLNDAAWLMFVMVFPEYTMQMICIAITGFRDRAERPTWPRWASWFCLWIGISGMGGGLAVFFKSGPFAWNGAIGFWIPITMFVIWLGVMTYLMHTAIRRQDREDVQAQALEAALAV